MSMRGRRNSASPSAAWKWNPVDTATTYPGISSSRMVRTSITQAGYRATPYPGGLTSAWRGMARIEYHTLPVRAFLEHTVRVNAGAVTFGVEYRHLDEATVLAEYGPGAEAKFRSE